MFFRKKEVDTENIFPDARELSVNEPKYPIISKEEILEKIKLADKAKEREIFFAGAYCSKQTAKELRKRHYRVSANTVCGEPCFKITL